MKSLLLFLFSQCLLGSFLCLGQTQNNGFTPSIPQPSMLPPNGSSFGTTPSRTQPKQSDFIERGQRQLQEHRQREQAEQNRQLQLKRALDEEAREAERRIRAVNKSKSRTIFYDFPSKLAISGTASYRKAFQNLIEMDSSFSITKAVFTTENAFFDNGNRFEELEEGMQYIADFLLSKMKQEGQDVASNTAKNLMIYRFFADTMKYGDGNYHLPIRYDFNDYLGREDFSNTMVLKVLRENSGQCHSLPLLYLMIAEYMKAEAYLVNSPNHTYIKFPLPTGGFQNIELTNHFFTTDVNVVASGYIKAEAMQSKIFMQPLSDEQLLSDNIADLAKGYIRKFGYDPFVMEMIDSALVIDERNIVALLVKANYLTYQFMGIERQLGVNDQNFQQVLPQYPKAVAVLNARNATYDQIDGLGYEPMPEQAYQEWLEGMQKEIDKRENEKTYMKLLQIND